MECPENLCNNKLDMKRFSFIASCLIALAMKLIEEYQELIERDSSEISFLWKAVQTVFYFLCAATGYLCSIQFYILWQDIFGGNCPLWAKLQLLPNTMLERSPLEYVDITQSAKQLSKNDWTKKILVDYEHEYKCKMFLAICLASCMFGIAWFMLFFMCGKGGYDAGIYTSPWRIVLPAGFFNFLFMIITVYTVQDMHHGLLQFNTDMLELYLQIPDTEKSVIYTRDCEIVQKYVEHHNVYEYSACNIFLTLQILSWIMMWSWIGGFVVLIVRILMVNDFRLLKVMIYDVPNTNEKISSSNKDHMVEGQDETYKEKEE